MSKPQCRTCSLPENIREELELAWAGGSNYSTLSEKAASHGEDIPPRTLNNHFIAGHSKSKRVVDIPSSQITSAPVSEASSIMTYDGGEITTEAVKDTGYPMKDFDGILRKFGFDPEVFEVSPTGVRTSRWQQAGSGEWLVSYRLTVVRKPDNRPEPGDEDFEFDSLRKQVFDSVRDRVRPKQPARRSHTVVVPADRQVGKVGSRGGTRELLERVEDQRAKLVDHLADVSPERVIYAEAGDLVEEFNSVPSGKFLNDLSLMGQLEVGGSIIEGDLQAIHSVVPSITAATCASNHAAWRNGKDYLGKPEDDWGIFLMKQVEKMLRYSSEYSDVTFKYPDPWEISVSIDVFDRKIGLTHGDKTPIDKTGQWWANQNSGNSPLRDISVLNTGHYHTPRTQIIGTDPFGGPVWWLLAPTADSGSDWWRHLSGWDSDPGLMVYTMHEDTGFDFNSLRIF